MVQPELQQYWGPCSGAVLSLSRRWLQAGFCQFSLSTGTCWGRGQTQGRDVPHHDTALYVQLDCTAVHWACRGGHLDAVKLLQDRGADLNVKDKVSTAEQVTGLCQGQGHTLECQSRPCVGLAGVGADPP